MNIYRSDKKGAGVGNYPDLTNLPQINGNTLTGNKTSAQLGIITKSVDDLVNYYLKTETYSSDEIDTLIETVVATRFEVVQQLPTVDIKTNVIYLVPSQSSSQGHVKDEWINLDGTTAGWEQIGSTAIDLSDYVTTTALNATLTAYVTNTALQTALQNYVTSTDLATTLSDYVTSTDLEDYITETDLNTALEDYTLTEDLEDMLAEKQDVFQLASMPTPSEDYAIGAPYQYCGSDTQDYKHGYWYECKLVNGSYAWVNVKVQDGDTVQVASLPNASQSLLGVIYQYTGATTNDYVNGFFYQCVEENSSYIWKNKPVQEGEAIQLATFPTASSTYANSIYQYIGTTNNFYTNGYFYKCTQSGSSYSWVAIPVQDSEQLEVTSLPTASSDTEGMVLFYVGSTRNGLTHNRWYECVASGGQSPTYSWVEVNVQQVGHTIVDSDDTTMTQRDTLKFGEGLDVSDDSTDENTVVDVLSLLTNDMGDIINPTPPTLDGKTATVHVVANWLACAGVTTSNTYSTLADLLEDSDTVRMMMLFDNSADYLVRCTDWVEDICDDETAMKAIGGNEYACDILLSDENWAESLAGSDYFEYVLNCKVPTMTSDTTPIGEAFANVESSSASEKAWLAFDSNVDGTGAYSGNNSSVGYIGYDFGKPVKVCRSDIRLGRIQAFTVDGSSDGETWETLYTGTLDDSPNYWFTQTFVNEKYYNKYRINISSAHGYKWDVHQIQFYGRAKV